MAGTVLSAGKQPEWHRRKGPCSAGACMYIAVFQVQWREVNVNKYVGVGLRQVNKC